jgi:hypothetical protein
LVALEPLTGWRKEITRSYLINTFKPLLDCKLCETE